MRFILSFILLSLFVAPSFAEVVSPSIELHDVSLQDALRIFANKMNKNMVISPQIHGNVSVRFKHASLEEAYQHLLVSYHLSQWKIHNIWYVGTDEEYSHYKEFAAKQKIADLENAPLVTRVWQIKYAKASDVARLIETAKNSLLTKRGSISVDVRTNIVCVQDVEENLKNIHRLIKKLDIPVRQVLIQAHIASIDSDCERELGFSFVNQTRESAVNAQTGFTVAVIHLPNSSRLHVQLLALEKSGRGELISSPSLFTASQQTAVIESGEEIPYQESSSSGATSMTFKKAVLSLKVTPQIMPNNEVLLQLQVNQDKPSKRMVLGVPAINTRQVTTNVRVKSGQTVVLGGIYEMSKEQNQEAIPLLSTIPLIGWLFKQREMTQGKRELFIFVTPRIMD